jgi:hypothetical protein
MQLGAPKLRALPAAYCGKQLSSWTAALPQGNVTCRATRADLLAQAWSSTPARPLKPFHNFVSPSLLHDRAVQVESRRAASRFLPQRDEQACSRSA